MLPVIKLIVETSIKYAVLCLCMYYLFLSAIPQKPGKKRCLIGAFPVFLLGVSMILVKPLVTPLHPLVMILVFTVSNAFFFHYELGKSISLSVLSFCACYAVFLVVGLVYSLGMYYYNDLLSPDVTWTIDLKTENWINVLTHLVMEANLAIIVFCSMQNKRIRNGFGAIANFWEKDGGLYLSVMLLSSVLLFSYAFSIGPPFDILSFFFVFLCIFFLFVWIRHEIKTEYLSRLREANFVRIEESLRQSQQLITSLRKDNRQLADIIRKDDQLIPEMLLAARECAAEHSDENETALLKTAEKLEALYVNRLAAVVEYQNYGKRLPKTGISSLDAILGYMQRQATADGITFTLDLTDEGLSSVLEQAHMDCRQVSTILADLIENALIAVRHSNDKNGAVAVRMGRNEKDQFFLSVSDSGIPFAPEVLAHMGKKRITTHRDTGGSGIGLMTLFALLKEYRASFHLEDFSRKTDGCGSHGDFAKRVTITFDGADKTSVDASPLRQ